MSTRTTRWGKLDLIRDSSGTSPTARDVQLRARDWATSVTSVHVPDERGATWARALQEALGSAIEREGASASGLRQGAILDALDVLLSLARRPSTRTLLLAPEILIGTDDDDARLDGQERDATTSRELLHGGAAADERFEGEHWLTYDLNEPTDDESSEEEESTSTATTDDDDNHEGRTASSPLTPPPPPPAPYHPYRYWGTDPGSPSTSASARLASKQQARLEREAYGALVQRQYWRHRRRRRQTSEPPAPADQEDGEQEREEMDLSEQELVREVLMALRSPAICRLASSHDDESSVIFRRLDQSKQHSDGESGDQEQEQIAVRLRRDFRLAHLSPLALHATLQPFARALELILTLERDLATLLRASPPESRARQRAGQRGHVLHSEEEAAAAAAAAVHAFVSAVREALQHAQARIARLELALVGGGVASCGGSSSSSSNNTPPTVISILALKRDVVDVLVRTLGPLARVACACVESRRQRASLENGHGESDETVLLDALVREISEQEAGQPPSLEDGDARGELGAREPEAPAPSQVAAAAPARVLRLVLSRTAEPAWRDLGVWLARGQLIRARANVFWISLGAAGEQQHSDALDDDDDDDEEPFVVECRVPEMFAHVAQKACEAGAQQTLLRSLDLPESELARSGDVATWPSITQVVLGSSSTPSLDLFASAPLVAATHGERVDSDAGLPFELMLRRAISRSCAPYISASSRALHAALMRSCDFSPLVHAWHDLMLVRAASGSFLDALLDATDKNARYWADSHALAALASAHRLHRTRIHVPRIRGGARHGGGGGGGGGDKNNNADNDDAVDRALARIEVQHELVYPIGRVLPVSHGEVLQDAWRLMARTQLARRRVDRLATRHTDPSLLSREAHALRFKLSHALAAVGFVWDAVAASQLALFRARLESTQSVAQVRAAHEQLMDALARQMFLTDDPAEVSASLAKLFELAHQLSSSWATLRRAIDAHAATKRVSTRRRRRQKPRKRTAVDAMLEGIASDSSAPSSSSSSSEEDALPTADDEELASKSEAFAHTVAMGNVQLSSVFRQLRTAATQGGPAGDAVKVLIAKLGC